MPSSRPSPAIEQLVHHSDRGSQGRFQGVVEFATLEWVDWFNHRRLLAPIGHVPPAECEQQYYLTQEAPVMEAAVD